MRLKVLLIQEDLKNYRDPIYRLIAEQVDLTVAYTTSSEIRKSSYPIISLPYRKIGPIIWHKNLNNTIEKYDVIVFVPHLRMVRVATLPFFHRKQKLVTWSIGIHASYKKIYDLTRERIRQIEEKALKKLRNPVRSKKIKDYLYD